jgi:DNA-binding XRE family transcriptional regulator
MTAWAAPRAVAMASTFGRVLKRLRQAAGLSQMDLAVKAGLNRFTVAKLEQGQREPAWSTAQALAQALHVSCEAFVAARQPDAPPAGQGEPGRPKKPRRGNGGAK